MAPIENLRFHNDFPYDPYIFREKMKNITKKPDDYGVTTTGLTKPLMAGCLIEFVSENIKGIKSRDLVDQFSSIERTNSGSIRSSSYSDLFMASCFCAYVRNKKASELMPILERTSPEEYYKESYDLALGFIKQSNLKNQLKTEERRLNNLYYSEEELVNDSGNSDDEGISGFIPFFSS